MSLDSPVRVEIVGRFLTPELSQGAAMLPVLLISVTGWYPDVTCFSLCNALKRAWVT